MEKFCSNCGNKLSEKDCFCSRCGTSLQKDDETTPEDPVSEELAVEEKTPAQPGITEEDPVTQAPVSAPQKHSIKKRLIGAVAVILISAALICAILFGHSALENIRIQNYILQLTNTTYMLEEENSSPAYSVQYLDFDSTGNCHIVHYFALGDDLLEYDIPYAITDVRKQEAQLLIGGKEYLLMIDTDDNTSLLCQDTDETFIPSFDPPDRDTLMSDTYHHIEQIIYNEKLRLDQIQQEEALRQAQEEEERAALLEENQVKAETLFYGLRISTQSNYSIKELLDTICEAYTVEVQPAENSETLFILTVNAVYYPNKVDLDFLTEEGTMVAQVDIETSSCTIVEDSGLFNAMNVYLALGTNWWEDEIYW